LSYFYTRYFNLRSFEKIGQANRLHNDEKGAGTPWMYMIPQKTTMPKWLQQESRGANT